MIQNKTILLRNSFTALATCLVLLACNKNDNTVQEDQQATAETTVSAQSDDEAEAIYNDVFDNAVGMEGEVGIGAGIGIFGRENTTTNTIEFSRGDSTNPTPPNTPPNNPNQPGTTRCFTVTVTPLAPNVYPKTVTVDFGNGCVGRDGRTRRGKTITAYTGPMSVVNSQATTTFQNYFIDSNKVEGTHVARNTSTSNNRGFTSTVTNGKITRPNGNYTAWNRTRSWLQTEGNGTPNSPVDDVFRITGNANGTVVRGTNTTQWTSEITEPLIRRFTCRWLVRGIVKTTRNTNSALLNYGTGNCDNQAVLTVNGNSQNITLP